MKVNHVTTVLQYSLYEISPELIVTLTAYGTATMAQVVICLDQPSTYRDNRSEVGLPLKDPNTSDPDLLKVDRETERRLLGQSSTLYVGNLSFYTTEAQIYERQSMGRC